MGPVGIEPTTCGLKVRCSTAELKALKLGYQGYDSMGAFGSAEMHHLALRRCDSMLAPLNYHLRAL